MVSSQTTTQSPSVQSQSAATMAPNSPVPSAAVPAATDTQPPVPSPSEIDFSCRLPLLVLFLSGAVWLLIASAFALIGSIKFHAPDFLAGTPWLTYGRVRPAFIDSLLYGFCIQAGLGVSLWLLARLGQTRLNRRWAVTAGAAVWNLGLTIGVVGILWGDSSGFAGFEIPRYAIPLMFMGYVMLAFGSVVVFNQRRRRELFVSEWFLLAALFWFPWILSTAALLLDASPVRGVVQAIISWWYSSNLQTVWLGLVGLAAVFYMLPKLLARPLHTRYLALFTFWTLILFGTWTGVPASAPVPAWIPALSTAATVLTLLTIIAVAVSFYQTACDRSADALVRSSDQPAVKAQARTRTSALLSSPERLALWFVTWGVLGFIVAGVMRVLSTLPGLSETLGLTWFTPAQSMLNLYGFFSLVMFGAIYHILPGVIGIQFPSTRRVRAHFWLALSGIALVVLPLAGAGILEGVELQNPARAFVEISSATLPFLRVSTLGDLVIAAGHVLFSWTLAELVLKCYRARAVSAYKTATADLFHPVEVKS